MRAEAVTAYLTSRRNLVGCGLALLGAALALIDPVGPAGLLLVAGFYGLGAASVRPSSGYDRLGFNPRQLEKSLQHEIADVSGRLPPEVMARLRRIELVFRVEILPDIDCLPAGSLDLYLVERTASDYLPTAVKNYLRLSDAEFSSARPAGESLPLEVFDDELRLLEAQAARLAAVVQEARLQRALAHRRFLNDRFGNLDVSG